MPSMTRWQALLIPSLARPRATFLTPSNVHDVPELQLDAQASRTTGPARTRAGTASPQPANAHKSRERRNSRLTHSLRIRISVLLWKEIELSTQALLRRILTKSLKRE